MGHFGRCGIDHSSKDVILGPKCGILGDTEWAVFQNMKIWAQNQTQTTLNGAEIRTGQITLGTEIRTIATRLYYCWALQTHSLDILPPENTKHGVGPETSALTRAVNDVQFHGFKNET